MQIVFVLANTPCVTTVISQHVINHGHVTTMSHTPYMRAHQNMKHTKKSTQSRYSYTERYSVYSLIANRSIRGAISIVLNT